MSSVVFKDHRKNAGNPDYILEPDPGSDQPMCSVCVANFNGMEVIGPCLESVLSQDFDQSLEIIVHDDGSSDGSAEFIRNRYPQVRLLVSQTNEGFCVANNRMVAQARGRFILLLNNDATLFPDSVRTLYDYATQQKRPGILGLPQYNMEDGSLIDIGSQLDLFLNPIPNRDPNRRQVAMVTGACFWIPKSLWDELGGFPAFFGSLAEDLYLCCLATLRGHAVEALSKSGFYHWVGKNLGGGKVDRGTLRTTYRRRALSERNKMFVMITCYPIIVMPFLVSVSLVAFTVEGIAISLLRMDRRLWRDVYLFCLQQLLSLKLTLYSHRLKTRAGRTHMRKFLLGLSPLPQKLVLLLKHGLPELV